MERPIRILQFPGTMLVGGVGSVVMNLYRNIDRSKVQFDFCVPRRDRGPLDDEIESMGGRIFSVPEMRKKGCLAYIKSIVSIIRQYGPYSAVHIHSVHMGAIAMIAAKKADIKKIIYHVHNTQDPALKSFPFHAIIEKCLSCYIRKNSSLRLACGMQAGRYVYGNSSFQIINNAVDLNRFYPYDDIKRGQIRDALGIQNGQIVVGNVARFAPVKNMSFFVRLAQEDSKNKRRLHFLLVGDGPLLDQIKKDVEDNGLQGFFTFTGNRRDVEVLYNAMDVFCLPSYFEGLPVSAMEAQAVGLPCVISDTVTSECAINGDAVFFKSLKDNASSWLDLIYESMAFRESDKRKLANNFTEKKYEIGVVSKGMEELYLSEF